MKPIIHIVPILRDNYCFVIEGADKRCIIVDPGQVTPVESFLRQHELIPALILNTHHHADHVAGNADLKSKYSVSIIGPKAERGLIPQMDKGVEEGDVIEESGIRMNVIETPGHTKGHVVFYCEDAQALLSGDTLFSMGCGRLLEDSADNMFASLQKIKSLPAATGIYCGHEYTQANGAFAAHVEPDNQDIAVRLKEVAKLRINGQPTVPVSLDMEMRSNPFLRAETAAEFARLRTHKDNF